MRSENAGDDPLWLGTPRIRRIFAALALDSVSSKG